MMRLAPVTAVSHGHPVSSGIHREALDYYVSWAAAELELEQVRVLRLGLGLGVRARGRVRIRKGNPSRRRPTTP